MKRSYINPNTSVAVYQLHNFLCGSNDTQPGIDPNAPGQQQTGGLNVGVAARRLYV